MTQSANSYSFKVIYSIVAFAAIAIVVIAHKTGMLAAKDLIGPVLALFGTFLGALFAFRLNQEKENKKLHLVRQEALNRACFSLVRQANAIRQLKKDFERFDSQYLRAFNLPALKPPDYKSISLNITELDFLLETDDPNVLFRLAIEFERFQQAIESVVLRCDFYVKEFQPKLAEIGMNGKKTNPEEMENLLGERIFKTLINSTENAFDHLKKSDESLIAMLDELIILAKKVYPEKKFIRIKMTDS